MKESYTAGVKNVLFAEDDEDFFYFFKAALLSVSGKINLLRTTDGVTLLSLMETSIKPDIIFLDINMPFKSGIDCIQEIRTKEKHTSTKVIMCSASDSKEDIENCYKYGADFYFIKPSGYSSLVQQFENLFDRCQTYKHVRAPRSEFVLD